MNCQPPVVAGAIQAIHRWHEGLQEPSLFRLTPTSSYGVSPDGKRIALVRTSQTGQQIVRFTIARPNDVATVVDLAGSGEFANRVV